MLLILVVLFVAYRIVRAVHRVHDCGRNCALTALGPAAWVDVDAETQELRVDFYCAAHDQVRSEPVVEFPGRHAFYRPDPKPVRRPRAA